jgi:hypothetical protein
MGNEDHIMTGFPACWGKAVAEGERAFVDSLQIRWRYALHAQDRLPGLSNVHQEQKSRPERSAPLLSGGLAAMQAQSLLVSPFDPPPLASPFDARLVAPEGER